MAEIDVIKEVIKRNDFYRRQYLLCLFAFVLSLLMIAVLVGVMMFLKRNPTKPVYFATDSVGRLIQVVPESEPNMRYEDVVAWVKDAVESTYSYDFVNYQKQFQDSEKYFTQGGWKRYLAALTASNNIVALQQRKMVVIARMVAPPTLIAQGLLGSAYAYKFEMPMLVTYWLPPYDEKSKFSNPLTVTMVVQRQSILQSYRGLGIVQIVAAMAATGRPQPTELSATPTG